MRLSTDATWLPADATAPRLARAFVLDFCNRYAVPLTVVADAVQVADELVANAVQHGRTSARLGLAWSDPWLTVEVIDGAPDLLPVRVEPTDEDTSGRGLGVVNQLAERVVWSTAAGEKAVQAVLTTHPDNTLRL